MKVLSLFDRISCGRVALERAGIPVEKYYASEIDKYAISVTQAMFPDTIQVGDVNKLNYLELLAVDMIIGGSPCQDLSIAKQNRQGLRGERSGLFWKYVEALEVIRPKWFLLENVASMKNEDRDAITETLKRIYPETECVLINSALVSAQQRKRYYWTNWHVEQPDDRGILLKDILENSCLHQDKAHCLEANYYKGASLEYTLTKHKRTQVFEPVGTAIQTVDAIVDVVSQISSRDFGLSFQKNGNIRPHKGDPKKTGIGEAPIIYSDQNKAGTLIASHPVYIPNLCPNRIGTLAGLGKGQANRIYSVRGKSVYLNANGGGGGAKTGLYKIDLPDGDYIVRKLTPRECARLQTYPERCFDVANISNTQWYKAFGNGWTVDVIAHIFSSIPETKGGKK